MKTCIRWAFILGAILLLAAPTRSQISGEIGTIKPGEVCAQ